MKWATKKSPEIEIGTKRIIRKFLLIPKWLPDEWRWLEFAYIKQGWMIFGGFSGGKIVDCEGWHDVSWANAYDIVLDKKIVNPKKIVLERAATSYNE